MVLFIAFIVASLYFTIDYCLSWLNLSTMNLALLVAVLLFGQKGGGAQLGISRWLSAAAKFAKSLILYHYLETRGKIELVDLVKAGIVVGIPMALILVQPIWVQPHFSLPFLGMYSLALICAICRA